MAWLDRAHDPLQRATAADVGTWLADDLLVKFDRMAMAHSLEGRAPFLQPVLAETGLQLPSAERMRDGESKVALRRVARRWLPPTIQSRRKQGFVLPMESWLKQWFKAQGGVGPYFRARPVPGLDTEALIALVAADVAGRVERQRLVFALVALAEWHESFRGRLRTLGQKVADLYPRA